MDVRFQIDQTRWTVKYIARNGSLADAQELLEVLREVVTGIERRISAEKLAARQGKVVVVSALKVAATVPD